MKNGMFAVALANRYVLEATVGWLRCEDRSTGRISWLVGAMNTVRYGKDWSCILSESNNNTPYHVQSLSV